MHQWFMEGTICSAEEAYDDTDSRRLQKASTASAVTLS